MYVPVCIHNNIMTTVFWMHTYAHENQSGMSVGVILAVRKHTIVVKPNCYT